MRQHALNKDPDSPSARYVPTRIATLVALILSPESSISFHAMLTKSLLPLSVLLLRAVGSTLSADLPELPNGLEEGPDGQVLSHRIEDLPHVVKYYEARALNQSETEDDGDAFEKRQIGTDPKPSKASLAGMQTPSGKGTFPNQYITANGGFVWECPLECKSKAPKGLSVS